MLKAGLDFRAGRGYHGRKMGELCTVEAKVWTGVDAILGSGVYALVFYGEIVYVGQAKRLLHRIYQHKNAWERARQGMIPPKSRARAIRFNGVMILPVKEVDLDRVEKEMIARYRPRHNRQNVPKGKSGLVDVGFDWSGLIPLAPVTDRRRRV